MLSSYEDKSRARDEQILSAKKKLKSFRAKQAQMAQAQSSSSSSSMGASKAASADVAGTLMAELDMQSFDKPRHSRTSSRCSHGRGHSRAGSISISAHALASQVASSSTSNSGVRPTSVHTASSGHVRSHSRSGSRNLAPRQRASGFSLGGRKEEPVIVAIEHPAGTNPLGEWRSETAAPDALAAGQPEPFSDVSALFSNSASLSLRSAPLCPSATAPKQERRQSRHARRTSVATKRESMEIMGGLGLGMSASISTDSIASSRRRSSRMSGLPSASILFGVPDMSSDNKKLQHSWDWKSAFSINGEETEGEQGRLTALEKLEGRVQPAAAADEQSSQPPRPQSRQSRRFSGHQRQSSVQLPSFEDVHGTEGMDRRASHNLLESNEKTTSDTSSPGSRESWRGSLAAPATSSACLINSPKSPTSPLTLLTSKRPDSKVAHAEPSQPEGLGTLMEEEEEEESLSPVRERQSIDMPLAGSSSQDDEMRKQRRLAEEETIKRNRRASLTPRPLKLKSRPPSLYLASSLGSGLATSTSLPTLCRSNPSSPNVAHHDMDKTPRPDNAPLPSAPPLSRGDDSPAVSESWPSVTAQQKPVYQDSDNVPISSSSSSSFTDSPQPEITRAFRTSMVFSPPIGSGPTPMPSAAPRERQGMRTLRLGSQASLASLGSIAESSSSTGSVGAGHSTTTARRRSIIGGDSGSISLTREELGNGLPSTSIPRNARRSSIHYKPSGQHASSDSTSGHAPALSLASLGGVPVAVHDELKAKASRDAALLESTKEQVDRLQRELTVESERSAREYAEIEHRATEEKMGLLARLEDVERAANESTQKLAVLQRELDAAKEATEDLEAERDVLKDDVEGWRSRCQDLEKSLQSERSKLTDQRKLKVAARSRIQQLAAVLEMHEVEIPSDDLNVAQALEEAQPDVATALRSPALGSASPVIGGGYFAPASADPPPMTIKLLADMRQQIINLAGSLEHERAERIKATDELSRLQEEHHLALNRSQSWTNTSYATSDAADESCQIRESQELPPPKVSPESRRTSSSASVVGKNKRHVFAYDSSMGSFGQSCTSLGSASVSMTTDESTTDDEGNVASPKSKAPGLDADAVGLGMGGLQTLEEIDEVSESGVEDSSNAGTNAREDLQSVEMESRWIDMEAGMVDCRPSIDVSESSFGERQFEDAASPMHFQSEKFSSPIQSPQPSITIDAKAPRDHGSRSTGSSLESNDGPTTPPLDHHHYSNRFSNDDDSTMSSRSPSPRPEFLPNWNFEIAARRGRFSRPQKDETVEDFFGIMQEASLPPLSTSEEAIDMPPIHLDARGEATFSRGSTRAATAGRRPPVARSAYVRESYSESGSPFGSFQARETSSFSATSSAAAFGSRALSRMSLQGLTSAFSGLSGYLTNQSGAAVTAAAVATKMCAAPGDLPEPESAHASLSWTAQRQALDNEDDEEAFYGTKRPNSTAPPSSMMPIGPGSWSTASDAAEISNSVRKVGPRPFVDPASIPPPMATPVWQLDFARVSSGGPIFSL